MGGVSILRPLFDFATKQSFVKPFFSAKQHRELRMFLARRQKTERQASDSSGCGSSGKAAENEPVRNRFESQLGQVVLPATFPSRNKMELP